MAQLDPNKYRQLAEEPIRLDPNKYRSLAIEPPSVETRSPVTEEEKRAFIKSLGSSPIQVDRENIRDRMENLASRLPESLRAPAAMAGSLAIDFAPDMLLGGPLTRGGIKAAKEAPSLIRSVTKGNVTITPKAKPGIKTPKAEPSVFETPKATTPPATPREVALRELEEMKTSRPPEKLPTSEVGKKLEAERRAIEDAEGITKKKQEIDIITGRPKTKKDEVSPEQIEREVNTLRRPKRTEAPRIRKNDPEVGKAILEGREPAISMQSVDVEPIIRKLNIHKPREAGAFREAWNIARGTMSVDLPFITSAGFRQGLPLVGTKNWFKAWGPSIRSYGSEAFYNAHTKLLDSHPLVKRNLAPVIGKKGESLLEKGRPVLKEQPSILDQMGVVRTDTKNLTSREEAIRSQLAEKIPFWGNVVKASNRAYSAFINDLRVNTANDLYEAMPDKLDPTALKKLGNFVGAATGRGRIEGKIPLTGKEVSLEKYAEELNEVLWSPRNTAAKVQMLNPFNYIDKNPQVRKEYLKSALRMAGAWTTFSSLAKLAGAEVNMNPTSADFAKIRFGDTRLDPGGGMLQLLVLYSRLATGEKTSSTTGKVTKLGEGYKPESRGSLLQDFTTNRLHPSLKYFYDATFSSESRPFGVLDRAVQLAVPMISEDLISIAKEQPELLPGLAPLVSAGMGLQHYEGGDFNKPKFVPEEFDVTLGKR